MINEVYNVVQEILNKNGYGLLTPTRFVSFAESAQLKVLDETVDEYRRKKRDAAKYDAADTLGLLESVIDIFSDRKVLSRKVGSVVNAYHTLPTDYMRWGVASVDNKEIIKQPARAKASLIRSYFLAPTDSTPFCYIEGLRLYVLPTTIGVIMNGLTPVAYDEVELSYYRYPKKPNWTYSLMGNKPLFNPSSTSYQDFELPQSMFNKLVIAILAMAGVHMRDEYVSQFVESQDKSEFQKRNT